MKKILTLAPLSAIVSLATLSGILLHDTKIDKLTASAIGIPAVVTFSESAQRSLSSDPHTHVERVSGNKANAQMPQLAPRHSEQKKHLLQKRAVKGAQDFDTYNLPVLA